MNNTDVARIFAEIADLLEIKGDTSFRVNSYRRVARALDDLATDVRDLAARGELASIPGIGKGSAEKIEEWLKSGKVTVREDLAAEVPESLLELREIPGLGPRKIAALWKERDITNIEDLRQAIAAERLAGLKGFGAKSIAQIQQGIDFLTRTAGRARLGVAWAVVHVLKEHVADMPGVQRAEHAGSLRRGRETVGDLDLLCIAENPKDTIKRFTKLPGVEQVYAAGETKGSILFEYRPRRSIQVDLRVIPAESFGAAWQYFTGSKEHNVRLRERAQKRGWSLNEYGLTENDRPVVEAATEQAVYAALDLPWIPPELREDRGELDLDRIPPDLLTPDHIRGDLHLHTTESDGRSSLEEMVEAARQRGYEYICVADHSQSSSIANGLSAERLLAQVRQIREFNEKLDDITILAGSEVDILAEGRLDFPDDLLAQLDFVVASLHYGMSNDIEANTERTLAAIRNPYVNVIGHPTGRLINRREAMPIDIEAISREAAATGTALEINASNQRLDLKDQHARLARDLGVTLAINTDAHHTDQYGELRFGVLTARRAWIREAEVLNTRPLADVRKFVQAKRDRLK